MPENMEESKVERLCSHCGQKPAKPGQRYCQGCRRWIEGFNLRLRPQTKEQKRKSNARRSACAAKKRGKLIQKPCAECGNPSTEMHHRSYDKPLEVIWLCAEHHRKLHRMTKRDFWR